MGFSSVPKVKLICRSCLSRASQCRGVASINETQNRAVPLRIFATENVSDNVSTNFSADLAREDKGRRYQEWLQKRMAEAPPNERLSKELKTRVGRIRPRGLKKAVDSLFSFAGTSLRTRTRNRRDTDLTPVTQIDPNELIEVPKTADSEDAIHDVIENCIVAAIDRLELYPQHHEPRDLASNRITIPHDQYVWLSSILQFQFSKQQLIRYGAKSGLKKTHLQRSKTPDAIALILDKVWDIEKEPELPPDEALVTKSVQCSILI